MVAVARIALATPAMSTPATHANLQFFGGFEWFYDLIYPITVCRKSKNNGTMTKRTYREQTEGTTRFAILAIAYSS